MTAELRSVPKPVRSEKRPRKRLRAVNPERRAKLRAKHYPVRSPVEPWCVVALALAAYQRKHGSKQRPEGWTACWGRVEMAHVVHTRGSGRASSDLVVDLCHGHHREQEGRSEEFEARYNLDLAAEAARRAVSEETT